LSEDNNKINNEYIRMDKDGKITGVTHVTYIRRTRSGTGVVPAKGSRRAAVAGDLAASAGPVYATAAYQAADPSRSGC
jgi:hypothetical protein